MSREGLILAAALPAVLAAGCINLDKSYSAKRFFVLDVARQGEPLKPVQGTVLRLRRFQVSRVFEGKEFVYRKGDLDYESDFYNVFFVAPGTLISDEVRRWMSDARSFQEVLPAGSGKEATHYLEGAVTALFGDYRDKNSPRAVLGLKLAVLQSAGDAPELILIKDYRRELALKRSGPEALAAGWNQALGEILSAFETDLKTVELSRSR
jgi:hypothetical protein